MTGKAGENGQYSGDMGGSSPKTRPPIPGCVDTSKALASSCSISIAIQVILAPASGSLSTGSPASRTLTKKGNGSMYSQAHVGASALRLPGVSVAVRDRGF